MSTLFFSCASLATPALAAPRSSAKAACVQAHEDGQRLRTERKLHAARERFVACAKSECPGVLRKECAEQVEAIESATPSLVFEARDEKGDSDAQVKVTIDGSVVAERLTGGAIDVEPGDHTVTFTRGDGKTIEQKILVVEGEKNRKVVAEYASLVPKPKDEPTPPVPAKEKKVPLASYVAGGVAVVGLGSFAFFALTGKSKEDDLAGTCSPSCSSDDVRSVDQRYLFADVSLGVAAVATVVAVVLALPALTSSTVTTRTARADAPWLPKIKTRSVDP